ncbi:hypothetical protein QLH52_20170 [Methylomonas sp. OY6]|uniref:Uncharacterized protein n=1 Tax=Methylomonas defluvii TaxID=3045149 RepID=A0ABU4UKP7_9GAMM|nr:hypothetical protein [Methylomonas sp. OY6]MDX8129628.1 hypothetical protein [Methylomonas sp. OY6]
MDSKYRPRNILRLTIDIIDQQQQSIKALADLKVKSIKEQANATASQ